MEYLGVTREYCAERVIEKSRFLSYLAPVRGEEDAQRFLADVRRRHPLATHVCYAFIADAAGNLMRFSDDGEPHGTAGMPILGVLKAHALRECAIAVVRYFGGTKLGAGGLVRAYTASAADAIEAAEIVKFEPCIDFRAVFSYADVGAASRCLEELGVPITGRDFSSEVVFTFTAPVRRRKEIEEALISALLGRVKTEAKNEHLSPFPLSE